MIALVVSMILSSSNAPDDAVAAALYAIGRTGLMPDGSSPAGFLASASTLPDARLAAWAAWSAGLPLESGPALEMLEFGAVEPTDASGLDPSDAVEALALRAMHVIASGEQPPVPELLDSLVSGNAPRLDEDTMRLVLQLFGRLGLVSDALPDVCRRPDRPSLYASWLRYCGEAGIAEATPGLHCLPYPARLYAARLAGPEDAAALLSDSIWAVRYEAAGRCDPGLLESLLDDEVPYVALRAASLMRDAGVDGWHEAAVRLSGLDGPVGFQAAMLLDSSDAGLLRTLLSDPQAARRLSAQQVWLGAGLPVDEELETSWLRDPYWIIPVSYLEVLSGRGDSTRATETARAMLETRDDRDLRQGLAGFLGIELPEGAHEPRLPVDVDTLTALRAVIVTDQGEVVVDLMTDVAPVTCATFAWLAGSGFYDGIWFHRVIPGFVAQAGCPQGNGFGGPGFTIPNERSTVRFTRGVVGMADAGLDTGGSQFFIMLDDHDRLDCRYTAFGRVTRGEDSIDRITVGTLIREVRIEHVEP